MISIHGGAARLLCIAELPAFLELEPLVESVDLVGGENTARTQAEVWPWPSAIGPGPLLMFAKSSGIPILRNTGSDDGDYFQEALWHPESARLGRSDCWVASWAIGRSCLETSEATTLSDVRLQVGNVDR